MPLFYYRASHTDGTIETGRIERENERLVADFLNARGLLPVEIAKPNLIKRDLTDFTALKYKLKASECAVILNQLSYMLGAGLGITYALQIVRGQCKRKIVKNILLDVEGEIDAGGSLSQALARHRVFPAVFSGMANVGEKSGRMPEVFAKLASYYEIESKTSGEIRNALIYPFTVAAMMLVVIIISIAFVLPGYARIFSMNDAALPLPTRILIDISAFLSTHYKALGLSLVALLILLFVFFRGRSGRFCLDTLKLNMPPLKFIYRKIINARFSYVLEILLGSGVDLLTGLLTIRQVIDNRALENVFDEIIDNTKSGMALSQSLSKHKIFDPLMTGMIKVGEETGSLPVTIGKAAAIIQDDLNRLQNRVNKLVEPLITIVLGLILVIIMLAVMLPSITLTNII